MCDRCADFLDSIEKRRLQNKLTEKIKAKQNGGHGLVVTRLGIDQPKVHSSSSLKNDKQRHTNRHKLLGALLEVFRYRALCLKKYRHVLNIQDLSTTHVHENHREEGFLEFVVDHLGAYES